MTADELADIIDRLRLTQAEAAKAIGSAPRSIRHYIKGDRAIPESVAMLARALAKKAKGKRL